jgi:para-aminobenzoate synthetase component I
MSIQLHIQEPNLAHLYNKYGGVAFLNSNDASAQSILAFGVKDKLVWKADSGGFAALKSFREKSRLPIVGFLSYDLKNELFELTSENLDGVAFPNLCFFEPEVVMIKSPSGWNVLYGKLPDDSDIFTSSTPVSDISQPLDFRHRMTKEAYGSGFNAIKNHLLLGDIYEVNYCQEFYVEEANIDMSSLYQKLNTVSQAPFSTYFALDEFHISGASPERFLKREGEKLISQPIKGTIKRGASAREDAALIKKLESNPKEINENVMIVDLVRNDLSHYAKKASVKVEELCQVYTFNTVHQLISTVSAEVDKSVDSVDLIASAFPMGSMTGVPKKRALEIIEQYENFKRGAYSGALGYIMPNGDFDFNVMIRTFLYNQARKYLSFSAGSAITTQANLEDEYQECLLKVEALKKVLVGQG